MQTEQLQSTYYFLILGAVNAAWVSGAHNLSEGARSLLAWYAPALNGQTQRAR